MVLRRFYKPEYWDASFPKLDKCAERLLRHSEGWGMAIANYETKGTIARPLRT